MLKAESKPPSESHGIQSSTRGLAFLGTPFRGSKHTDLAKIIESLISIFKQTNTILEELEPGKSLSVTAHNFSQWLRKRSEESEQRIEIALFFEDQAMTGMSEKVQRI